MTRLSDILSRRVDDPIFLAKLAQRYDFNDEQARQVARLLLDLIETMDEHQQIRVLTGMRVMQHMFIQPSEHR